MAPGGKQICPATPKTQTWLQAAASTNHCRQHQETTH